MPAGVLLPLFLSPWEPATLPSPSLYRSLIFWCLTETNLLQSVLLPLLRFWSFVHSSIFQSAPSFHQSQCCCTSVLCILLYLSVWCDHCNRVIGNLYSAILWDEPIARDAHIWPVIAKETHSFTSHLLTNHTCIYSPAAGHHRRWLVLITPTHRGMARLSWPRWLVI